RLDSGSSSDLSRAKAYRRPAVLSPAAEPSLSHFVCSFQGSALSWAALGSAMSGVSLDAQEASAIIAQNSKATLVRFAQVTSGIRASIDDNISGLHLHPPGQAACDDIADGSRGFNR